IAASRAAGRARPVRTGGCVAREPAAAGLPREGGGGVWRRRRRRESARHVAAAGAPPQRPLAHRAPARHALRG
ncbi:unnamed protein product, partial [Prorocentrum cordatum]